MHASLVWTSKNMLVQQIKARQDFHLGHMVPIVFKHFTDSFLPASMFVFCYISGQFMSVLVRLDNPLSCHHLFVFVTIIYHWNSPLLGNAPSMEHVCLSSSQTLSGRAILWNYKNSRIQVFAVRDSVPFPTPGPWPVSINSLHLWPGIISSQSTLYQHLVCLLRLSDNCL